MDIKNYKYTIACGVLVTAVLFLWFHSSKEQPTQCPTPETFVQDFTKFSVELLDANPGYAEKEQRYYWQKHLEEMGCIESQQIIDNATCADCNEDGSWTAPGDNATST